MAIPPVTPDSGYGSERRRPGEPAAAAVAAPSPTPVSAAGPDDLMLVIEEDPATPGFIYKTVNRRTGEVIRSLSRAQLLELRKASSYAAGAVLSTRA
jgi:flagellar protein FlaG